MIAWWLSIVLIGILALPLSMRVFGHLPGRGLAWSKALGLLVVAWLAWMGAMLNLSGFDGVTVGLGLIGLGTLGWFVQKPFDKARVLAAIRQHWPEWLAYELLFGLVFWLGIQLRLHGFYGSGIHSTEKPMEAMLFSAVLNSPSYPPSDLWLAGFSVNYYYFGYVLISVLSVLSGATLGETFNLGLATIMALASVGVAGLVTTMVRLWWHDYVLSRLRLVGIAALGVLGCVLVLLVGNQMGALQTIVNSGEVNKLTDSQRVSALWQALQGIEPVTVDSATLKSDNPGESKSSTLPPMGEKFNAWWPSRVIYDDSEETTIIVDNQQRMGMFQREIITEFPFFSFYLADMHPHVLSIPLTLLAIALALAVFVRPAMLRFPKHDWLELAIAGLVIGGLYAANSWDAPTFGLLYALGLVSLWRGHTPQPTRRDWLHVAGQVGLVVLAAVLLYMPFLLTFTSFAGRDSVPEPFANIPIISSLGKIMAPARDHSGWTDLLIIFGLFLVPIVAWLTSIIKAWQQWAVIGVVLLLGLIAGIPAVVFLPIAVVCWQTAWQRNQRDGQNFSLIVVGLAALIIVVVDFLYLRDIFDNRMNTVFKVYYQAWMLLGITAAASIWGLLSNGQWRRWTNGLWLPLFGLLLAGGLVYPISVINPRTSPSWDSSGAKLDGIESSNHFLEPIRKAAAWLEANTPSNSVLATAPGSSYQDGGELATLSARPTLLTWPGSHEGLWRSKQPDASQQVAQRQGDLNAIYNATDLNQLREVLSRQKVDYVVWGPNEQKAYPQANIGLLEQAATKVYEADGWIIYQVQP
ncbi:DUF2298 domain-containing protein [Herpetosiphon llansteffanensis]